MEEERVIKLDPSKHLSLQRGGRFRVTLAARVQVPGSNLLSAPKSQHHSDETVSPRPTFSDPEMVKSYFDSKILDEDIP